MLTPEQVLKQTFGYETFRPLQREIIQNVLAKQDTLAIMPTGGGKSLCYQIPALIFDGLTVVVSPLIALMKDQVEQMRAAGVPALYLNSSLSAEAYQANMEYVRQGQVKLLYLAPETLMTQRIFDLLDQVPLACLTIDEAHCISEWGHDFRPEYRQLVDVRKRYPGVVCLALTATATPRVRTDIKRSLGFPASNEFVASFNRTNLYIEVTPKRDGPVQVVKFLERFKDQSGIIYCFSRKQVDELTDHLARRGFSVRPYHAGLEDETRRRNQDAFIRDDVQIMVATVAFGMGINKPNVRFVVHFDLPKSVEGYYQEIGRAGRDGLPAHCLLLYSYGDVAKLNYFIKDKQGEERKVALQHLDSIVRYAEDENNCRRKPLLNYFGESYPPAGSPAKCANCDNCNAEAPVLEDITVPAQKFLSCVKRTGERFGAGHVTEVLLGSKAEKIIKYEHDKLSTYGIGSELTSKQWMHLARQLAQMGYLNQDEEYHTLSLTPRALEALKARTKIFGQLKEREEKAPAKANKQELEYNHALFALLRDKRKTLADQAGVPPYVIFSDRSLVEMAAYYPQTSERFLDIAGVGQVKAAQYGETFIELIRGYCQKHKIAEKPKEKPASREKSDNKRRYVIVSEAYNQGTGARALAEQFKIALGTVLDYLGQYAADGNPLRSAEDLLAESSTSPEQQQAALQAFERLGTQYLKPVFDELQGAVSYDELKILRLVVQARQTH